MLRFRIFADGKVSGVGMRRNLKHVKHLLALVQAYADHKGIQFNHLAEKWTASGSGKSLEEPECLYLVALCKQAGYLSESKGFKGARLIQMTWSGHDYLDLNTSIS